MLPLRELCLPLRVDRDDEGFDAPLDLVADGADRFDALANGVFEGRGLGVFGGERSLGMPSAGTLCSPAGTSHWL